MPTVTPYYGSAAGNGFPFCLDRVNVVDFDGSGTAYDYWSTLGGFNKDSAGSPSAAQISLSLQNAWRMYWMVYGMETSKLTLDPETVEDPPINGSIVGPFSPVSRVCLNEDDDYGVQLGANDGFVFGISPRYLVSMVNAIQAFAGSSIIRMYNGSIDDEANFVGYGLNYAASPIIIAGPGLLDIFGFRAFDYVVNESIDGTRSSRAAAIVALSSMAIAESVGINEAIDYDYVTVKGISFTATAYAAGFESVPSGGIVISADATTLTASASVPGHVDADPNKSYAASAASITIDDILFYNE